MEQLVNSETTPFRNKFDKLFHEIGTFNNYVARRKSNTGINEIINPSAPLSANNGKAAAKPPSTTIGEKKTYAPDASFDIRVEDDGVTELRLPYLPFVS